MKWYSKLYVIREEGKMKDKEIGVIGMIEVFFVSVFIVCCVFIVTFLVFWERNKYCVICDMMVLVIMGVLDWYLNMYWVDE